ncbi:type VI secretion system contractile sheath large subunit [Brucella oryzae]|uniref:type VI secretion system contractile sheath large subunit n=1 Tax=Brucella oryzae TaxID=335286 RepID=UPI00142DF44C|nr:type VI secretion system contractile sheath large subunit [Brucella oryzae]
MTADRVIVRLDQLINAQVNAIMQHPDFIAAECRWRGVLLLVHALPKGNQVRLKLLQADWLEISQDCNRCEFDHTWLFELIYNQEFAMPGGEPFGLLIGDYMLGPDLSGPDGTENILTVLAAIAAAAFCPFVAGAAPCALGLSGYGDLNRLPDLISRITRLEFTRWNKLRQHEDSRFLGLVAPGILLRSPYRASLRQDSFHFEEYVAPDGSTLRFGNGCFAFAINVMRNFIRHGWFSELCGITENTMEGGYIGENILPPYIGPDDLDRILCQPPVEVRLTTDQQQQFCAAGIIPVATSYLMSGLVFNVSQSLYLPPDLRAHDNAALSGMLQYVLCVSRFAHCLKAIMRDEIGSHTSVDKLQDRLQNWLLTYTLAGHNRDAALRIRYPLRASRVSVREIAGRPGLYSCMLELQPHLHLDKLHATFRLLIDETLPATARVAEGYSA